MKQKIKPTTYYCPKCEMVATNQSKCPFHMDTMLTPAPNKKLEE